MIGKNTIETTPISSAEVKTILEEFSETHELSYEQNLALAQVTNFKKLSLEKTNELIEELSEVLEDKKQAIIVANLLPKDLADLRLIFAKERYAPDKEDMEKILEILEKYYLELDEEIVEEEIKEENEE